MVPNWVTKIRSKTVEEIILMQTRTNVSDVQFLWCLETGINIDLGNMSLKVSELNNYSTNKFVKGGNCWYH